MKPIRTLETIPEVKTLIMCIIDMQKLFTTEMLFLNLLYIIIIGG